MNELGDNKPEKKMVTITTASDDKEKGSNCVTPKKKAVNNTSSPAAASTETTTEQTAPNILVYKKVGRHCIDSVESTLNSFKLIDGIDCREDAG